MLHNNMKQNSPLSKELAYPARINKYLAAKGYATRLGADDLVRAGRVTINGKKAELGSKVQSEDDTVVVAGVQKRFSYYAYHKPAGIETVNAQKGEKAIAETTKFPAKVFPIGRLDKDSRGLLIMTDDGRVTKRLLEPEYEHEKEYQVTVDRSFDDPFLKKLSRGVDIGGYVTKSCVTKRLGGKRFSIILTEGKNRQIRNMVSALGNHVTDLVRVRIMNVKLANLPAGKYRPIDGKELTILLRAIGL